MREVATPTTPRRLFATVSQSQMEEGADVNKDAANPALSCRRLDGRHLAHWSLLMCVLQSPFSAAARGPGGSTESVSV